MRDLPSEVADAAAALDPAGVEDVARAEDAVVADPDPAAVPRHASPESPRPRSSNWTARRPSASRMPSS